VAIQRTQGTIARRGRYGENMSEAERVLNEIDNLLQSNGYDSWRQSDSGEWEKVGSAFFSFLCDWQKTKTGELRDEIIRLEKLVEARNA
jgi:hypothetical protein